MKTTSWLGETLVNRARRDGQSPLVTYHRPETGERTELTVRSFLNWVDKTSNLLAALGMDADARVALPVLVEYPAHWMALVWPLACWQAGIGIHVEPRGEAAGADLAVIGPDSPAPVGYDTLACSLHPWGLPLTDLPAGVSDYSSSALSMPDAHSWQPAPGDAPAWFGVWTFTDLAERGQDDTRRLLVDPDARTAVEALLQALTGSGSLVIVVGEVADDRLARIATQEHAS